MAQIHKNLTQEKWNLLEKDKQILNIGAELMRAKNLLKKNEEVYFKNSLSRAFELVDLTIGDKKWKSGLKEMLRLKEMLGEFYIGVNKNFNDFVNLLKVLLTFNKESEKIKL